MEAYFNQATKNTMLSIKLLPQASLPAEISPVWSPSRSGGASAQLLDLKQPKIAPNQRGTITCILGGFPRKRDFNLDSFRHSNRDSAIDCRHRTAKARIRTNTGEKNNPPDRAFGVPFWTGTVSPSGERQSGCPPPPNGTRMGRIPPLNP